VPADRQAAVTERIVADMQQRGWLQTAGDVGFHYLVRALANHGRSDAIFKMLARTELGSYQYLVNAGWTTLPESWNAYKHYSMNHCMLGHIQEWFSEDLVGIAPAAEVTSETIGFRRFELRPTLDGSITSASGSLRTPYGEIRCSWNRAGKAVTIKVHVPVNSEAVLRIRNGVSLKDAEEGTERAAITETAGNELRSHIGSGTYNFAVQLR
jgi:hypothetical protein